MEGGMASSNKNKHNLKDKQKDTETSKTVSHT